MPKTKTKQTAAEPAASKDVKPDHQSQMMTEEEIQDMKYKRTRFQKRALCSQKITLQSRQIVSTLTQIVCPLFGLLTVHILRAAVLANAEVIANINIIVPIPFIYNIPMKPLSNFESIVFNVSECDEWYMYTFEEDTPQTDKDFFGFNPGEPLLRPRDEGMLRAGRNVLTSPCKEINRTVPYFLEH